MLGINLTNAIIKENALNAFVAYGKSPKDTANVIKKHFHAPLGMVFIDGLHTNAQLLLDFESTAPFCNERTMWVMHDVINWHLQNAFSTIAASLKATHKSQILHRTQSGMAACAPLTSPNAQKVLNAFSEDSMLITQYENIAKSYESPLRWLKAIIPSRIKTFIKTYMSA